MSAKYVPSEVEPKWQAFWAKENIFATPNPGDLTFDASKPKYYILDMFPYPSGAGLHVGHPEGYTATDILARFKRMKGFNVLHPMGWDAFGLPAEQYAVQTGTHPAITTQKNINAYRSTLQRLGFSYDWNREVNTTDPKYIRWTQWIFLKLFNSVFDPVQNKARDVNRVMADLDAGKIGLKNRSALVFEKTAEQAAKAGFGPQWKDLNVDDRWRLIANHRLAFISEAPVWWCEELGTVLANEEVINGLSDRGNYPCVKRPLRQWMLRITAYADRLISDLESIEWPEAIKSMQRHWIGRSEGAEVDFEVVDEKAKTKIRVFTTRPDTLYGATYMVLAPEHPLVKQIASSAQREAVNTYVTEASRKSDLARTDLAKDKSGVFTGAYAYNPVYEDRNDQRAKIPIWIADYVLMGYGTGAIMAVPAHDTRDAEFAQKFNLKIIPVVMPPESWLMKFQDQLRLEQLSAADCKDPKRVIDTLALRFQSDPLVFGEGFVDDGVAFNSPAIDGLPTPEAKKKIIAWLEEKKLGERKITYKLRDWLFSRQRYWGEPFPIVWDTRGHARALTDEELPVELPQLSDYKPTGSPEGPLGKATDWLNVHIDVLPDGMARIVPPPPPNPLPHEAAESARRETNTMPQWAGSCWYYLRYCDPNNSDAPIGLDAEKYWMNVDMYVGGAEHAVLHLLYSRFWHKALFDLGVVHTNEPFQRLFNQGPIQAFVYQDPTGRLVPNDEVVTKDDNTYVHKTTGQALKQSVGKMSKSLKNVVPADDVLKEYGADTFRLYEMFMGPLDGAKPWNPRDVPGMFRFLRDCWRMIVQDDESKPGAGNLRMNLLPNASDMSNEASDKLERDLHKTIKGVTQDLDRMAFNTAISKLMVFKNSAMEDIGSMTRGQAKRFLTLLAPFAPHIAEELWSRMRNGTSVALEQWPTFDEALTQDATKELAVQVNGKMKARITVAASAADDDVKRLAQETVKTDLAGKTIVKVVVVPGRLVNIVVK
jgi:leucyl-tRNA synthetase